MNKKILYIATLMLAMTSVAFAQNDDDVTAMRLTFNNEIIPEGLSDASDEGTVGVLDGVEAIVVDLGGSIGKVAIATKNYGASSVTDRGYGFGYDNAMLVPGTISGTYYDFGKDWYLPSKTELDALLNRLTWNSTRKGAEINFGETSLFLPACGYRSNGVWYEEGSKCVYWSSTAYGTNTAYRMDMSSTSKEVMYGQRATGTPLRTFHALPKVTTFTAPVEREHLLEVSSIENTSDGIRLTVNGQSVTYPFDMLKKMTFFNGTPAVAVTANEDPDNKGNYYSTFYSSLEAYNIPDGVNAYTAEVEGENVKLTKVAGNILPKGEAVLLRSKTTSDMSMTIADNMGEKSTGNQFKGVDVSTDQDGITHYMLSYGQNKLGFYKMNSAMVLSPNKAFIELQSNSSAKALRFVFQDDMPTGINDVNADDSHSDKIFNLSGMRLNKMQKGINIVNGKKILVK